jgi:hypothetical protein
MIRLPEEDSVYDLLHHSTLFAILETSTICSTADTLICPTLKVGVDELIVSNKHLQSPPTLFGITHLYNE